MARLLASVPPEVNRISDVSHPMRLATWVLATFIASAASYPMGWPLEGLPHFFCRKIVMRSKTRGSTGVVAL
jgi:hypothetical protein